MVLVSELGGAWRFDHPRQLMAYLGLVPSESTSSEERRCLAHPTSLVPSASSQGGITKAGNSHARWLLIEAAHHYRLIPSVVRGNFHLLTRLPLPHPAPAAKRHWTCARTRLYRLIARAR